MFGQTSNSITVLKSTFTAVSRVISFPIRSTRTGRHAGNSDLRLSPNVETTSPMQEMAHSLTSWNTTTVRKSKFTQETVLCHKFTNLILILVCQTCHDGIIDGMNIRFEVKTNTLRKKLITFQERAQYIYNINNSKQSKGNLTSMFGRTTRTSSPHTLNASAVTL